MKKETIDVLDKRLKLVNPFKFLLLESGHLPDDISSRNLMTPEPLHFFFL
jgi:hypothetical protein